MLFNGSKVQFIIKEREREREEEREKKEDREKDTERDQERERDVACDLSLVKDTFQLLSKTKINWKLVCGK